MTNPKKPTKENLITDPFARLTPNIPAAPRPLAAKRCPSTYRQGKSGKSSRKAPLEQFVHLAEFVFPNTEPESERKKGRETFYQNGHGQSAHRQVYLFPFPSAEPALPFSGDRCYNQHRAMTVEKFFAPREQTLTDSEKRTDSAALRNLLNPGFCHAHTLRPKNPSFFPSHRRTARRASCFQRPADGLLRSAFFFFARTGRK